MTKYAFIDRDGTIIYEPTDTHEVKSVKQLKILEGVVDTLKMLIDKGFTLVIVTNQDGLGGDGYTLEEFKSVEEEMIKRLRTQGVTFDSILICPHFAKQDCSCRKPKTGLVSNFKDIDKEHSIVIGDRQTDMEFARNLGIKGIKVKVNKGMKEVKL